MSGGLLPDRPLSHDGEDEDQLGFGPLATRLAQAIVSDASSDGLVIGLEGRWGSGKSSLTSLTRRELLKVADDERPRVIEFRPWLIGNRDALLASLFDELRREIDEIENKFGREKSKKATAAREASAKLKKFASRLEPAGDFLEIAGSLNPIFGVLSSIAKASAKAAKEAAEGPSIANLKKELDSALSALEVKIVVIIDDVDRLEPSEIGELLRLVRSVADFKNVVYVLCYDPEVLAHALEVASNVSSGRSYLEKIVQVAIPVPNPEPFLLRRWFERSLSFLGEHTTLRDEARLRSVIDEEGGKRLDTPRTVVRALNAVHFSWRALEDKIDLPDMVWIQLIRVGNPDLYRWIEDYTANICAIRGGKVVVSKEQIAKDSLRLTAIAEGEGISLTSLISNIGRYIPGTRAGTDQNIYRDVGEKYWDDALKARRLASPEHYRLYFALEAPPLAMSDAERTEFSEALKLSPERLGYALRKWLNDTGLTGLSKAEVLFERIRAGAEGELGKQESINLLIALSNTLDDGLGAGDERDWLGPGAWRQADRLLPILLTRLDPQERKDTLRQMFEGDALAWLTSIYRTEYFSHGIYGDQKIPESKRLMNAEELDLVTRVIIKRYETIGLSKLLTYHLPAHALYAWKQTASESFDNHVIPKLEEPETFFKLLESLKTYVTSTRGNYWTLSEDSVQSMLSSIPIRMRLDRFADYNDARISEKAKEFIDLIK